MQTFELIITVSQEDLDDLNHVNNVRYVQWVQDVAERHWDSKATKKIVGHFYWVMLSHNIQYKGQAFLNDALVLKTFVTKAEGVTSTRIVEIYNKTTGKLLTTSETNWCFISKKNHRPARITKEIIELFD
ncbi:acyl-CoA thioesterase [Flavobacteriaceae bacterium LMO-SS05]